MAVIQKLKNRNCSNPCPGTKIKHIVLLVALKGIYCRIDFSYGGVWFFSVIRVILSKRTVFLYEHILDSENIVLNLNTYSREIHFHLKTTCIHLPLKLGTAIDISCLAGDNVVF